MIRFPSYPASILTGAVVFPVLVLGWDYIQNNLHSPILLFVWVVVAFYIPIFFSTMDFRYLRKRWKEQGLFSVMISREDFKKFYFPAWKRLGVVFISAVVSMSLLKLLGVEY